MKNFAKTLADTAVFSDDAKYIRLDNIATGDIANVRVDVIDEFSNEDFHIEHPKDMAEVCLMNKYQDKMTGGKFVDVDEVQEHNLKEINKHFFPSIKVMRQSNKPVNEFEENKIFILKGFAHLFLFGERSFGKCSNGPLSDKFVNHLVRQRSNAFAQDKKFLFTMANQRMRHKNLQSVHTRAVNRPDAIAEIGRLSVDPEFIEIVKKAVANPKSVEAKKVGQTFDKLIRVVGANTPYSPGERAAAVTLLYAQVQMYGLPFVFFTLSLDDTHTVLAIRMCFPTRENGNEHFPAVDDGFAQNLNNGNKEFLENIDITDQNLIRLINSNPVAAADFFQMTLEALYAHVLGLKTQRYARKTLPLHFREKGVFGRMTSGFHAIETSARKALHGHCLFWGGLPTSILQSGPSFKDVMSHIKKVLDDMFINFLPNEYHIKDITRLVTNPKERGQEFKPRLTYSHCPSPKLDPEGFCMRCCENSSRNGIHQHHCTCEKGASAKLGCRSAHPKE